MRQHLFLARGKSLPHFEIWAAQFESGRRVERLAYISPDEIIGILYGSSEAVVYCVLDKLRDISISEELFQIWSRGQRSHVRLDDHREHYAYDPSIAKDTFEVIQFRDESGQFEVNFQETATLEQGLAALKYWLITGGRLESLTWS